MRNYIAELGLSGILLIASAIVYFSTIAYCQWAKKSASDFHAKTLKDAGATHENIMNETRAKTSELWEKCQKDCDEYQNKVVEAANEERLRVKHECERLIEETNKRLDGRAEIRIRGTRWMDS